MEEILHHLGCIKPCNLMGYLAYQLVSQISEPSRVLPDSLEFSRLCLVQEEERASYEEKAKVAKAAKSNADGWVVLGVFGSKGGDYHDMTRKAEEEGGLKNYPCKISHFEPKKSWRWMGLIFFFRIFFFG